MAQPPETTFCIGSCVAKVWLNQTDQRSSRGVTLEKTYRDEHGNWQTTNNLWLSDLPAAIKLLQMALDDVAAKEAIVSGSADA